MSRLSFAVYVAIPLLLTPVSAMAQSEQNPSAALSDKPMPRFTGAESIEPDSGDYDGRALRFESHLGTFKIIQGEAGTVVGKGGWFRRFDLASIVAPSEKAVAEAREFSRNRTPGVWALSLGFVVFALDAIMLRVTNNDGVLSVATALGGTALMVYGTVRLERAGEALSRSLWWYNRDLKKSPASIAVKK